MKFTAVTLFPRLLESFFAEGLVAQALTAGHLELATLNPRQFTKDVHQSVDDRAFGGGDGMVMKVEPLADAIGSLCKSSLPPTKVVVLTPQGKRWDQAQAREWAQSGGHIVLVCGRYAGIDQRFIDLYADEEISIGDFILNGGEIAACAIIESVARLRPQVLGNQASALHDSFSEGLLESPQFTRPRDVEGLKVPAVLLSGDHNHIERFERAVRLARTAYLRPDLFRAKKDLQWACRELEGVDEGDLKAVGLSHSVLKGLL